MDDLGNWGAHLPSVHDTDGRPFGVSADSATPMYLSFKNYTMTGAGLEREVKGKGGSGDVETVWVCAAFEVLGLARSPDRSAWGLYLRWRDEDSTVHTKLVPYAELQGDAAKVCQILADGGLRIEVSQQRSLRQYLSQCKVEDRVTVVHRTGWHSVNGKPIFALPKQVIGDVGAETVIVEGVTNAHYEEKGSLADWQAGVGNLIKGQCLPSLAVAAALAGPLLHLLRLEGGGLNIFGASSGGKTTVLQAAASVWGRGATGGFMQTWRTTANGIEGIAALSSDTCLALDELGMADARDVAQMVYGLSNGVGKIRAARDGSARDPKRWHVQVISTGEVQLEQKLREDGGRGAKAGQLVRMLDVPADRGQGYGAFDSPGRYRDAASFSAAIKAAATSAYGTLGPAFVEKILQVGTDETERLLRRYITVFMRRHLPKDTEGQVQRAGERFGLICAAGEFAALHGLVPWKTGEVENAAAWAFEQWIENRGGVDSMEVRQVIERIRSFIDLRGKSHFERINGGDRCVIHHQAGWTKGKGAGRLWLFSPAGWQMACGDIDPKFAAKVLRSQGMLECGSDGLQKVHKIDGAARRAYTVNSRIHGDDVHWADCEEHGGE